LTLAHELCMVRPLQHQQPIKSEQWRKSAECRQAKGILKLALAIDCLHQQHEPSHCKPGRKHVIITLSLLAQLSRANFKTQLNASCKKGAAAIVSQQARTCKPHLTACAVLVAGRRQHATVRYEKKQAGQPAHTCMLESHKLGYLDVNQAPFCRASLSCVKRHTFSMICCVTRTHHWYRTA